MKIKIIVILFSLFFVKKLKAQDSLSTFLINLNINFSKNTYNNYMDGNIIGSQVKNITSILKPSIIFRTKKGNFREFELTDLSFSRFESNIDVIKLINYGNNSSIDTSFKDIFKINNTLITISHRYLWHLLKKKSDKYNLGVSFSNSFGFESYKTSNPLYFGRKQFSILTDFQIGLFVNYKFTKKLIVGIRKDLLRSSLQLSKLRHFENPYIPKTQSSQKDLYFDLSDFRYIPTIFVLSMAYKF